MGKYDSFVEAEASFSQQEEPTISVGGKYDSYVDEVGSPSSIPSSGGKYDSYVSDTKTSTGGKYDSEVAAISESVTQIGDSAKAVIGGGVESIANILRGAGQKTSLAMEQATAPRYEMKKLIIAEDRNTGKQTEISEDEWMADLDSNLSKYKTVDIVDAPIKQDEGFLSELAEKPGAIGEKAGKAVEAILPASIKDAQERVRINAGNESLPWYKSSWSMVVDNAPNLVASAVNPQFAYETMFANERQSMKQSLVDAGVDEKIANQFASVYGGASAPIEYAENAGRLVGAFGKKAKRTVISATTKPILNAAGQMLRNAGINVAEELTQEAIFNAIYNAAVTQNNSEKGTALETKAIFNLSEMTGTAKGSLGMSVILDAMGVPVRVHKHRTSSKNISKNLQRGGISKDVADKYSKKMAGANSQEQLDLVKEEMFKDEAVREKIGVENMERIQEIMNNPVPSEEETAELNSLIENVSVENLAQIEEQRIKSDVSRLAKDAIEIDTPRREDKTGNKYSKKIENISKRLSELYDRAVSKEEVYDAFVPPMDKVEIKREEEAIAEQEVNEKQSLEAVGNGDMESFNKLPIEMQEEIRERTTGDERELLSDVVSDIQTKQKEVSDADTIERTEAVKDEQKEPAKEGKEGKEGKEVQEGEVRKEEVLGAVLDKPVEAEKPEPDLAPILEEKVAPEAREAQETPIKYEYVPYADPTTESGIDKNSSWQNVRAKFLESGGKPENRKKSSMLKFINGSQSSVGSAEVQEDLKSLDKIKANNTKLGRFARKASNLISRGSNLDDLIDKIALQNPNSRLVKARAQLANARNKSERILQDISKWHQDRDIGNHLDNLKKRSYTLNVDGKSHKISLGQLLSHHVVVDPLYKQIQDR